MRGLGLGLAVVVGIGVGNACLLDLDHEIACGDGYVDEAAGEECDPAVSSSYEFACALTPRIYGHAECDPEHCVILDDIAHCASCGDGVRDAAAGEECERDDIPGSCPGGGTRACTDDCKFDDSNCDPCGNGMADPGEECEPGETPLTPDGLVNAVFCEDLVSPHADTPYTSGATTTCLDDCTWSRIDCGFCGNGVADAAEPIWVSVLEKDFTSRVEWCDDQDFNPERLVNESTCPLGTVDNVTCASNCRDFEPRAGSEECCLPTGAPCPADTDPVRCCHEYAQPRDSPHCYPGIAGGGGNDGDRANGPSCK